MHPDCQCIVPDFLFLIFFFYYWHIIFIVETFKNDLENSEDFYD